MGDRCPLPAFNFVFPLSHVTHGQACEGLRRTLVGRVFHNLAASLLEPHTTSATCNRFTNLYHPPTWQRYHDHHAPANASITQASQQCLSVAHAASPSASRFASMTYRRNSATQSTHWCQKAIVRSTLSTNYQRQLKLSVRSLARSVPSP